MKYELTENQINYILETYFEIDEYDGWKNIALKLLYNGNCIVAGDSCIWKGGIGNFIHISVDDNYVDCVQYSFDLKRFMESNFFKDIHKEHLKFLDNKIKKLEKELDELISLTSI